MSTKLSSLTPVASTIWTTHSLIKSSSSSVIKYNNKELKCQKQFQLNYPIMNYCTTRSNNNNNNNSDRLYSSAAATSALTNVKPTALQYINDYNVSALINPNHIVHPEVPYMNIPDVTLDEYVWAGVPNWSNKIAMVRKVIDDGGMECALTGRNYTYGQCRIMTKRFGSALIKNGLKPGDIIALVLPNIPEFPIVFLGANAAGLTCTLINPQYTSDEIMKQMYDCDVKAVVTISLFTPIIKSAKLKLKNLKSIIVIGDAEDGCHTFNEMMKDDGSSLSSSQTQQRVKNPKQDLVALPYSSGTTGKPKGVMLTHYNMVSNITNCIHPDWCSFRHTTKEYQEIFIVVLPFFHIYSLNAILMGGLSLGAKIICLPTFEPTTYIKALADYKPTFLHTVPRLMDYISTNKDIKNKYLERVHAIVCGGAPAGKKSIDKLMNRMLPNEIQFQEGYGMTEASPVLCMLKSNYNLNKLGSCGTPVPMTYAMVIDTETKESLGPYKIGEIYCRGPQVMKGYWKNEDATNESMDGDWLRTGDIGYYDDECHFRIVDRIKELIKVKGFQVAPSEIEELLLELPGFMDAAVIGIPDDTAGELPRAYIVKKDSNISTQDIHKYLSTRLAPYKQLLGGIEFMDIIPRNPSGKILRKELKAMAIESLK